MPPQTTLEAFYFQKRVDSYDQAMSTAHIFIRECLAIYLTTVWAFHREDGPYDAPVEYRIAVDNKAAGIAAQRCYSSNRTANEIMLRLWRFTTEHKIVLKIVDISTDINVADGLSRNDTISASKAWHTTRVLLGAPGRPAKRPTDHLSAYVKDIEKIPVDTDEEETWSHVFEAIQTRSHDES